MDSESKKIVIIGNSSVGKSAVSSYYIYGTAPNECHPTVGLDIFRKTISVDGRMLDIVIWDTAGQERFRAMDTAYFRGASMAIVMFAIDSRESFSAVENWFIHLCGIIPNAIIIIVGNKSDLVDKRLVERDEAESLANRLNVGYIETSAVTGSGIEELFNDLAMKYIKSETRKDELLANAVHLTRANAHTCC